jgi:hypothetical protein
MKTITLYGASDDLICFSGDLAEEIDDPRMLGATVEFSDGTILKIAFHDDGVWRIHRQWNGPASYSRTPAVGPDDDNYTDRVTLTGDLRWVEVKHHDGSHFVWRLS